ncbi:hypothetical protein [Pseudidiomarina salilacus]|uniref:hypothetical protein n=1 Tax=Pseudidiomarina salilacus TaxID=3384452 RepID=UPI0039847055
MATYTFPESLEQLLANREYDFADFMTFTSGYFKGKSILDSANLAADFLEQLQQKMLALGDEYRLTVSKIQRKGPENPESHDEIKNGWKGNCWYVAFAKLSTNKPSKYSKDYFLLNVSITPSDVNLEFRVPHHYPHYDDKQDPEKAKVEPKYQLEMQRVPLNGINKRLQLSRDKLLDLISSIVVDYLLNCVEDVKNDKRIGRGQSSAEYFVIDDLMHLFDDNYELLHGHRFPMREEGTPLELDILAKPKHENVRKFAIEIQGVHHYQDVHGKGNLPRRKELDRVKRDWCTEQNILLIALKWQTWSDRLYVNDARRRRGRMLIFITNCLKNKGFYLHIDENNIAKFANGSDK